MSPDHIAQLILAYKYWILIPLTFIEGPIVAFVAGTLAAAGYFNLYFLAGLFFVRDVGLDGVYYAMGHFGGRTRWVKKMLARLKITDEHLEDVRRLWETHPGKTMFIGKLSYGIASAFVVVAGAVKMPLRTYFKWAVVVAVVQYWGLLLLGYFLGNAFGGTIEKILTNAQYLIAAAAVFFTGYYIFTFYLRDKFFKEEEQIEKK
jgi:membrane protein DedA with SNARE-associated domain